MRIEPVSELACIVYMGDSISPDTADRVAAATALIRSTFTAAIIDLVPSYTSILVMPDIRVLPVAECCTRLQTLLVNVVGDALHADRRCFDIPAYYGRDVAVDLDDVAGQCGLSSEQVIELHSSTVYRVYAIGFAPGFCFLGTLDPRLKLARRSSPRLQVPAKSIAIAEQQTAIYPSETPGGWHIIGRTTIDMLALCSEGERPLRSGDAIRFCPLDRQQFLDAGGKIG